ncbi:MAG: ParB/RepB/Spo0J family partition protein [Solirubrobacterales bacterium]
MGTFDRWLGKTEPDDALLKLRIDEISTAPYQPRTRFDENDLIDLARSIQEVGLIQPVVVRKGKTGYELIAGERRLRACKMVGMTEIPAVLTRVSDAQSAVMGLIENIQRKELDYFEEARAFARLIGEFGMTQEDVARKVGKSQSAVANKLRLLKLDEDIRREINPEVITERHARALLRIDSRDEQRRLIQDIEKDSLTVKETEQIIDRMTESISREIKTKRQQTVTWFIKDVRIFLNTIKETVRRARESGIGIEIAENDTDEVYELNIRIDKKRK